MSTETIKKTCKNLILFAATKLILLGILEASAIVRIFVVRHISRSVKSSHSEHEPITEDNPPDALMRKIFCNVSNARNHSQYCTAKRQKYHFTKKVRPWKPDWQFIRDVLMSNSTTHGPRIERAVKINLPPAWAKKYICSVDESIYDICRIHNCNIELAKPESPQVYSSFVLSGSEAAIKEVLTILKHEVPSMQTTSPSPDQEYLRYVQSEHRRPRMPAHLVPKPEKWTCYSLLEYVQDLTAHDPSFHALMFSPSPLSSIKTNYCVIVMDIIRKLIENPTIRLVFSRKALHIAMSYFVRKNRLDLVRELYVKIESLGLRCNTETYNIMLRGSALNEDLYNFNSILSFMLGNGHKPNGETWALFMRALPHHKIRLELFASMKKKGLLSHPKTLQITVEHLIENDLETSLHQGHDHTEFIAKMNEEYGLKWLSVEVANRALAIFGKYCLTYRAFQFLEYMEECFQFPDECSINILLHSCTISPDPWLAIVTLMSLPKFRAILEPGPETCRILFKLAWKTKSYNMAKLTWRYACLFASTSMTIRQRVFRGLKNAVCAPTCGKPTKWVEIAGAIIIGPAEHGHPMLSDLESPITSSKLDSAESLSISHLKTRQDLVRRIDLDLQVFKDWQPCMPFASILWIAIERDRKWKANLVSEKKDLKWLVHNSESILLCRKYKPHKRIIWK